jgi:hypothetical protein
MAILSLDRDALLRAIAEWPVEDQIIFARDILHRAATQSTTQEHPDQPPAAERSTWDALYGIAANGKEPPTDEQVAQWLDEHRMEKCAR